MTEDSEAPAGDDRERGRGGASRGVDREEPVGEPVVRADPAVTGERASEAVEFDPDDPESVETAAETVRAFAADPDRSDSLYMLRGAAACAALVRGVGSYKAATERVDGDVPVSFVRKWARVHDLPQSVRRHVARGNLAPTAAKHVARVSGEDRLLLTWATIDGDLTVREVRAVASEVNRDRPIEAALGERGVDLGTIELTLDADRYVELRRRASLENRSPGDVVDEALDRHFDR